MEINEFLIKVSGGRKTFPISPEIAKRLIERYNAEGGDISEPFLIVAKMVSYYPNPKHEDNMKDEILTFEIESIDLMPKEEQC